MIFWMLVKGSRDHPVGRVYLAIQAALAYGTAKSVDVGWLMGEMMAQGRKTMGPSCENIGASGLAYFLLALRGRAGRSGRCPRITTNTGSAAAADGKEVWLALKTGSDPRSLHFKQSYEREKRKLETEKRRKFLAGYRWHSCTEVLMVSHLYPNFRIADTASGSSEGRCGRCPRRRDGLRSRGRFVDQLALSDVPFRSSLGAASERHPYLSV